MKRVHEHADTRVFLTAELRNLAMVNFVVDPALVTPHLPVGTELDPWRGRCLVSVVGLLFRHPRVLGVPIPFHRDFEQVNLRFYVRREVRGEVRRAVVFLREIVPRRAIASAARWIYNEPYMALPMRHELLLDESAGAARRVSYAWRQGGAWSEVRVHPAGSAEALSPGSEEEFITERHWGYTRQRDGGTIEYHVEHPRWRIWRVNDARVTGDLAPLYGPDLARVVRGGPASALFAAGSAAAIHTPVRI